MANPVMKPPVGYMGGKRSFAATIYPHLHLTDDRTYVEPFVGMGAVYLYARSQGWKGRAWLNDANPAVAEFRRCIHRRELFGRLLTAMEPYVDYERTNANHRRVAEEPVPAMPWEMVARWLWLQSASFGCVPVALESSGFVWKGCTFDNRASKPVQFSTVLESVRRLEPLVDLPTHVTNKHFPFSVPADAVVYGDPPYEGRSGYKAGTVGGHVTALAACATTCRVVISEQHAVPPDGFEMFDVGKRPRDLRGDYVASDRREVLFVGGCA